MYFLSGSNTSSPSIVFSYLFQWILLVMDSGLKGYQFALFNKSERIAFGTGRLDTDAYIVKTIPPLITRRANRGKAPDQNVRTPSFLKMVVAQTKLFL